MLDLVLAVARGHHDHARRLVRRLMMHVLGPAVGTVRVRESKRWFRHTPRVHRAGSARDRADQRQRFVRQLELHPLLEPNGDAEERTVDEQRGV